MMEEWSFKSVIPAARRLLRRFLDAGQLRIKSLSVKRSEGDPGARAWKNRLVWLAIRFGGSATYAGPRAGTVLSGNS